MDAHNKVMDTLNRLPKDKPISFGESKLTVYENVKTNTLLNAKVTLIKDDIEGQAEIKIHKPSDKRHKATIEIRRLTGQSYETVEGVKDILTNLLDNFTTGESVSSVLIKTKGKSKPYTFLVKQPSILIQLLILPNPEMAAFSDFAPGTIFPMAGCYPPPGGRNVCCRCCTGTWGVQYLERSH